ncbi:MAG: hypothetical protein WCY98_05215 [Castellaniella sp.]
MRLLSFRAATSRWLQRAGASIASIAAAIAAELPGRLAQDGVSMA